jgi:hypothetical protein
MSRAQEERDEANHPDVLKTQWQIAVSLQGQRKWKEAENLFTKILDQARNRPGVGRKHMYSLTLLYSLGTLQEDPAIRDEAMVREGAGRDAVYRASSILNKVLLGRIEVLGPNYLRTLTTKARLSGLHLAAAKEAQQVLKTVTAKEYCRPGIISAAVPWKCLSTLARCASSKSKELESHPEQDKEMKEQRKLAVNYSKQAAEAMEQTIGKQHPGTLGATRMWAVVVLSTGDTKIVGKIAQRFSMAAPGKMAIGF